MCTHPCRGRWIILTFQPKCYEYYYYSYGWTMHNETSCSCFCSTCRSSVCTDGSSLSPNLKGDAFKCHRPTCCIQFQFGSSCDQENCRVYWAQHVDYYCVRLVVFKWFWENLLLGYLTVIVLASLLPVDHLQAEWKITFINVIFTMLLRGTQSAHIVKVFKVHCNVIPILW